MSKKIILHLFACIVFMQSAYSQVYFQPGTPYVYRSLSPAGNTSVLTLIFDTNGNATISKSQETSLGIDKQSFYVMAPSGEVSASTYSDNKTGTVPINGSTSKYWLISFENPVNNSLENNTVKIECICKTGNEGAKCSVSYLQVNNNLSATCVPDQGCMSCEMKTTNIPNQSIVGGSLLIKANSVTIQ